VLLGLAWTLSGCSSTPAVDAGRDAAPPDQAARELAPPDRLSSTEARRVDAPSIPPGCVVITPTAIERSLNPMAAGVSATFKPALGAADRPDTLELELYEMESYKQAPGTFDLASKLDSDYATCNHCVLVYEDQDPDTLDFARTYYAESGTLALDSVTSDPVSSDCKGSLASVKLVEVTIDPDTYEITKVAGGKCLFIVSASWDTVVPLGKSCTKASDCGDSQRKVCDPKTKGCALGQCDFATPPEKPCGAGEVCRGQVGMVAWGACYPACVPFGAATCGAGQDCVPSRDDQVSGACYAQGTSAAGAACTQSAISTGCAAGLRCIEENSSDVCLKQCDFFAADPGCAAAKCVVGSVCTTITGDAAAIGAACASGAAEGTFCGSDGKAYRGLCDGATTPPTCRKVCRMGTAADCSSPMTCKSWSGGVGVCS
jgi:hypothetical protein